MTVATLRSPQLAESMARGGATGNHYMNSPMTYRSPHLAHGGDVRIVRLFSTPEPLRFAAGGLAKAVNMTRAAGRGDDEVLLHITPEEFDVLKKQWGEPTINPNTGLPEYGFLSKLWKGVRGVFKKIAPFVGVIASAFFPALAPALGGLMGASGATATALGNAAIGAASGAAGGGKKGALAGALTGGLGGSASKIGGALGLSGNAAKLAGSALVSGAGSKIQGGDFGQGALSGAMMSSLQPGIDKSLGGMRDKLASTRLGQAMNVQPTLQEVHPDLQRMPVASAVPAPNPDANLSNVTLNDLGAGTTTPMTEEAIGAMGAAPAATPGGAAPPPQGMDLMALAKKYGPTALLAMSATSGKKAKPPVDDTPPGFTTHLSQLPFNRAQNMPVNDWYTYGMRPEENFFADNAIPDFNAEEENKQQGHAGGGRIAHTGALSRFVRGPGTGRSDSIPAQLSNGEYVLTAEDVAMLGDGSSEAGAHALDKMRAHLRKHKGGALAKGKISPNAKSPLAYLKGGK